MATTVTAAVAAGTFELRGVVEVVTSSAPEWDSFEVTCIDTRGSGDAGCIDAAEAVSEEVVLLDAEGGTKYRLAPAAVTGEDVASADAVELDPGSAAGWGVVVRLTTDGTRAFEDLTKGSVGQQVAAVVDGVVVSAPTVQETITAGAFQLGGLSKDAAEALEDDLGGGS